MKKVLFEVFKYLLSLLLIIGGIAHFKMTGFYVNGMPDYLPFHKAIVYISGIIEILLGILLIIPKMTRQAAIGIVILFIVIFPANVNMYLNYQDFPDMTETSLLIRLPIQLVLIAWAYIYAKKRI